MKKYLALFVIFFNFTIFCQLDIIGTRINQLNTIKEEANHIIWQNNALTPEQLNMLLNFSCISFALVQAEHKLQEEAQFILHMAWYFRYDHEQFFENPEHLQTISRSIMRFKNLLKAKHILKESFEALEDTIDQEPQHQNLLVVTNEMIRHTTGLIKNFAGQETNAIDEILKECIELIDGASTKLNNWVSIYQRLIDGTYSLEAHPDLELAKIEIAHEGAESNIAQQAKQIMEATEYTAQTIKQVQSFGALAFYIYYKVTYDGMIERNYDERYFMSAFEDNCVLSSDPHSHKLKEPLDDTNVPLFRES
jgi:hypothetical protein